MVMAKHRESVSHSQATSQSKRASDGIEPAQENNARSPRPLAKSADPAYMKFTTYIRKSTHRSVKTRLVSKEKELSDLVEELLSDWLKENKSFST
jgi:hypothetical protein